MHAQKEQPWLFRTYAGHSTAAASNALYRTNLSKGQTGLSVAFDLPTQTGYDSDDPRSRGEVGKVGVPIAHLGDMRALFADIPLDQMNTSMTINAPAAWMLALYVALRIPHGRRGLDGGLVVAMLVAAVWWAPPGALVWHAAESARVGENSRLTHGGRELECAPFFLCQFLCQ